MIRLPLHIRITNQEILMQAKLSLLLALSSSVLLSACGGGSNSSRAQPAPPATNSGGTPVTAVITARFDPTNAVVPFPTNLLLSGTTDLTLNIPVANPANIGDPQVALNALDGFSTTAPWSTTFSTPPKPSSITGGPAGFSALTGTTDPANGGTVRVYEVTLTGPGGGVTSVVRELQSPQEFVVTLAPSDTTGRTLVIVPTAPLKQLTSYMAILKGNGGELNPAAAPSITDAAGNDITPDTTYFLAKRANPLCANGQSTEPLLPSAQACALEPLRQLVNSQEIALDVFYGSTPHRDNSVDSIIALSWVATTQSITPEMQAIQSRVEQTPAPAAAVVGTGLTLKYINPALPPIADVYVGALPVPYYLTAPSAADPTAPLHTFWHAAPGAYVPPFNAFGLDPTSTNVTFANPFPVATSTQRIPVLLTVPNANSGKTKPAAGWPIVIFQHGITRNRQDMFAIAGTLAGQGFAVIAIDAPLHGITDKTSPLFHNQLLTGTAAASLITGERTFDVDFENNTTGAQGPDGTIDGSGTYFINLSSLLTSRDNLRQASSDLFELTRAIPSLSLTALNPTGDFDGSRIEFVGQSLGSIIGTAFVAIEPHVNVALLNVPGGGVARLLDASPAFGPSIHAGLAQAGLTQGTPTYDQFMLAAQTVIDSGDSINFAFATANKAILAQEVVGDATHPSDQVIPNTVAGAPLSGTEPLLAALGLSSITATTQAAKIRGAVRFTAGAHGSLLDPTSSPAVTAEMQGEMASMIASGGQAVIIQNSSVIKH
jgi:Bacterial virulence factor lipase N-terminal/Platelet-activating factor acetylhydrolase, isoform II